MEQRRENPNDERREEIWTCIVEACDQRMPISQKEEHLDWHVANGQGV